MGRPIIPARTCYYIYYTAYEPIIIPMDATSKVATAAACAVVELEKFIGGLKLWRAVRAKQNFLRALLRPL